MTTATIETIERSQIRFVSREQAARLLEELRELYQSLSRDEQKLVQAEFLGLADRQQFLSEEF